MIKTIKAGNGSWLMAMTPDGEMLYLTSDNSTVTVVSTATGAVTETITVGTSPFRIAITPDGKTAYVVSSNPGTVTPISTATNIPARADQRRQGSLGDRAHSLIVLTLSRPHDLSCPKGGLPAAVPELCQNGRESSVTRGHSRGSYCLSDLGKHS